MTFSKISQHGYGLLKDNLMQKELDEIRRYFTVAPKTMGGMMVSTADMSFPCYRENTKFIYLPLRYGLKTYGLPKTDTTPCCDSIEVDFAGVLRDYQEEAVGKIISACNDPCRRGGLLCLYPGAGKTTCALAVVSRLSVKTLIVVHKSFLVQQWSERIREYVPEAKISLIRGQHIDNSGDICICTLQSISMKEYPSDIFHGFGLVIVDECHHIGAEVFSRALCKINFRYAIGLSATITRKDGLTKVIKWHMGDVVYKGEKRKDSVAVDVYKYYSSDPLYNQELMMYNGKINNSAMLNQIADFGKRTDFIIGILSEIKKKDPARNILVLSDRRNHLKEIEMHAVAIEIGKVGYYVGGMKEIHLKETENTCDIILATYSMAAEGMDIPKLDTLVLATPKSDVEQAIGRIQRKVNVSVSESTCPLVVDIVDNFSLFKRQGEKRMKFYNKMKYDVHVHVLDKDKDKDTTSNGDDDNVIKGLESFLID